MVKKAGSGLTVWSVGGQAAWSITAIDMVATLFNLFTDDLDNVSEFTPRKFADDTKPGGVADTLYGCSAVQRDLTDKAGSQECREVPHRYMHNPAPVEEPSGTHAH